jgi:hypothetical protein
MYFRPNSGLLGHTQVELGICKSRLHYSMLCLEHAIIPLDLQKNKVGFTLIYRGKFLILHVVAWKKDFHIKHSYISSEQGVNIPIFRHCINLP